MKTEQILADAEIAAVYLRALLDKGVPMSAAVTLERRVLIGGAELAKLDQQLQHRPLGRIGEAGRRPREGLELSAWLRQVALRAAGLLPSN